MRLSTTQQLEYFYPSLDIFLSPSVLDLKDICQDGISEMRPQTFCPALMFIAKHPSLPLFPHLTIPVYDTPIGPTNLTSLSFSRPRHTELVVISPPEISKGSVRHFRKVALTRVTQETRRHRPPCRRDSPTQVQRPPSAPSLLTCEEAPPIPTSTTPSTRVHTTGTTTAPAMPPGCPVSADVQAARIR